MKPTTWYKAAMAPMAAMAMARRIGDVIFWSGLAGELQLFHDVLLTEEWEKNGETNIESRKKGKKGKDLDILQTFISHAWKAHSWSPSSSCVACMLQQS